MPSGPEKEKETLEEAASPATEAGTSASTESSLGDSTTPTEAKSETAAAPSNSAEETAADEPEKEGDVEQLGLPGMPEEPTVEDPHHDEYHHDEYDQYHDEYHEEHFHDHDGHDEYGEYHHDEDHEDHHYQGHHDGAQHSAYQRGAGAALATGAAAGPLDQRNVPDYEPELDEDGNPYGGPVKPFLDHLEDLRWVILKCVIALLISMMGCMMGAKYLIEVLVYPLDQAKKLGFTARSEIPVWLGSSIVGHLELEGLEKVGMDTNSPVFGHYKGRFDLKPVLEGTNVVLTLNPRIPQVSKGLDAMVELKNYGPFQSIWLCLQLALYGGLVLGAPFIIFFVAEFVLPALKVNEKAFLYKAAGIGSLLFMLGVAFCYFLIVQVALKASVEFSNWMGFGADEWNAGEYLSFVVKFLLVMGVAFELPVVLLTIVKIGILDYKQLSSFRHYFIVGMLVASAVITPSGDPFTMVLVAVPLWILYEICVIIARIWYKRDQAEEAKLAADS